MTLELCVVTFPNYLFYMYCLFFFALLHLLFSFLIVISYPLLVHGFVTGRRHISALYEMSDATERRGSRGHVRGRRTGGVEKGGAAPDPGGEDEAGSSGRADRRSPHQRHRCVKAPPELHFTSTFPFVLTNKTLVTL